MFDPVNIDPFRCVVDPIEDAVIPHSKAVSCLSCQLQASVGSRVPGECADLLDDPFEDRAFEFVEVLLRRGKNKDVIHGAS
jgi:hypothetical protein